MKMQNSVFAVMITALLCYAPNALAEKDGRGHGKSKHEKHEWKEDKRGKHHRGDDDIHIHIGGGDRVIIREYLNTHYSHCPPGLAKKHNGCRPPGHAKRYRVGYPLADYVMFEPVPRDLLIRLDRVPVGHRYVMVDRDVLLISEATKHVIDAITLYSAVGY